MRRLVGQSLRRPSMSELEVMLRRPLGDPDLRLVFLGGQEALPTEPGRTAKVVRHAATAGTRFAEAVMTTATRSGCARSIF